jgi:hypothetical protein
MKQVFLHIGTHKTGTTSIQRFLDEHRSQLSEHGARFFRGRLIPQNHVELHLSAMGEERSSPIKTLRGITVDADFRNQTIADVSAFLEYSTEDRLLFSAEGLSYLRHAAELTFISELFADHRVSVIVFLRNEADFLRSYRMQLHRLGLRESADPASYAYTRPGSWLTRWDDLLAAYATAFGSADIIVRRYEDLLEKHGNVVPAFLSIVGLPAQLPDTASYWYNVSRDA